MTDMNRREFAKGALLIKAIPRNSFGVAGSSVAMEFSAK